MARSFLSAAPPTVAVEIARTRVSAASIHVRDNALAVAAHAVEQLPAGAVAPSLNAANIADPRAVTAAQLKAAVRRLRSAVEDGRLKMEEYVDRMGRAYQAATYGNLAPLHADLPVAASAARQEPGRRAVAPPACVTRRGVLAGGRGPEDRPSAS